MKKILLGILLCLLLLPAAPRAAAYEKGDACHIDLSSWIQNREYREYVEMMIDYHVRTNEMVQDALDGGFGAVFLFDGCSDNLDDPALADLSYYRVSGVCVVLKKNAIGEIKLMFFNDNSSTIPDRPLEYGAWSFPEVGDVGPATVCDGTYQLYSVYHKGKYEALHVRTDYYDAELDAVYMTPEGYTNARANEINIHTRTSNHTSGRGMWSAGCPLVGAGDEGEFRWLMYATYGSTYDTFVIDNFVGTLTIDRMKLRPELYTLYQNPDAVDMFLAASRKIQPENYLRQCTERQTGEESRRMKVAMDTEIMSLPCSNATDARSRQQLSLLTGTKLNVLGSIRNSQGNTWLEVEYEGQTGWVYRGHLEELGFLESFWDKLLN